MVDEISGEGNHTTAQFWEYDERIAFRWNKDPVVKHFESSYSVFGRNPIWRIDPNGDDWYIAKSGKKTGEYKWFEGNGKQKGYSHAGNYKVEYDRTKNTVNVYEGKNSVFKESINMDVIKNDKNEFVKFKDDRAAKFSMLSAESGGVNIMDEDPFFDPLIISASIDNRQKVSDAGNDGFASYKGQAYIGYHAKKTKAYKDFSEGNKKRFNDNMWGEHLSLSTVYNALDSPVTKLKTDFQMKQANYILYYSHPGGHPQSSPAFNLVLPTNIKHRFVSVQGDKTYMNTLDNKK
ncbi:hypothetical protein FMM05_02585 [Flavobacterium zepuense]|uniref:RHS repeat-associated core domain-containing protein n=1 Tax=Flavobacterium zepuense TaxID=2593302 RepID=A0A552VAP5_9FLAO|nr:hypothetical protein [Flavobacterium zepuense]TRW27545.1 hypothetical protein FMM05_02585 [Flavobacterium zepuense]